MDYIKWRKIGIALCVVLVLCMLAAAVTDIKLFAVAALIVLIVLLLGGVKYNKCPNCKRCFWFFYFHKHCPSCGEDLSFYHY